MDYLARVWEVDAAELLVAEVGADAIAAAVAMIRRMAERRKEVQNPAGLLVHLARRVARARRRHGGRAS